MTEAILYLKENRDLWGIEQVREDIWRIKANKKHERTVKKMKAVQEEERQISVKSIALGMADLKVEWGKEGAFNLLTYWQLLAIYLL